MINVAIGQSRLLLNKKFMQFRGLVEQCATEDPDKVVTCEDLHGFWDMAFIQVINLDKRFDNLKQLKANNWVEIIPEVKRVNKIKVTKKKVVQSSSRLKDMIKGKNKTFI